MVYVLQKIGTVIEVFIPYEYKDSMESKKIGFKVKLDNEEITIIEEQNKSNSKILKGDRVVVTKKTISDIDFTDIELSNGDENEQ